MADREAGTDREEVADREAGTDKERKDVVMGNNE